MTDHHHPYNPLTKDGQTPEGRLIYEQDQMFRRMRRQDEERKPGPGFELGAFGKKLLGAGLLLFGYWTAPSQGAPGEAWLIPGGCLALGAFGLIKGLIESRHDQGWRPFAHASGFRGRALRALWTFRPRLWMLVWAAIVGVFVLYGSPHVKMKYGPAGCGYLGLNGWERTGGGNCPFIRVFRLRAAGL